MTHPTLALAFEWLAVLSWGWVFFRLASSERPLPIALKAPVRIIRFFLIMLTFGLLAGCSNPDPIAVASGPLFPLNAGHWQPTQQDLSAPPRVVGQ